MGAGRTAASFLGGRFSAKPGRSPVGGTLSERFGTRGLRRTERGSRNWHGPEIQNRRKLNRCSARSGFHASCAAGWFSGQGWRQSTQKRCEAGGRPDGQRCGHGVTHDSSSQRSIVIHQPSRPANQPRGAEAPQSRQQKARPKCKASGMGIWHGRRAADGVVGVPSYYAKPLRLAEGTAVSAAGQRRSSPSWPGGSRALGGVRFDQLRAPADRRRPGATTAHSSASVDGSTRAEAGGQTA